MPATRTVIDGLWRCLCPSFDAIAFSQLNVPLRKFPTRPSLGSTKQAWSVLLRISSSRPFHSGAKVRLQYWDSAQTRVKNIKSSSSAPRSIPNVAPSYASLDEVPIAELHDSLRHIRTEEGAYKKIADLVEYLVKSRGENPSLLHYDALIRANADASQGSADVVAQLLREMKEEGIVPDSGLYHSALKALAIHPDYLLRSEVLREMKDQWFALTTDGWHNLVVGLLRDRQYEVALDKLEQMQQEGTRIQPWLYDIFIYLFCEAEEFDEALKILRYRVDHGDMDISANVWYYVLDACSSNYNYEGTQYVWRKRVETSYINPSDGMCTNVLNTAARHLDPNLATDVVRVLSSRTSKLDVHHYDALISAYIGSSDLKTALQVLSIMKKACLEPGEGTTRPIYTHLRESKHLPSQAFKIIQWLQKDGQIIPTAAVNVILEASVSHGHLEEAITQYKALHTICPSGPNTATFNALLQGCSKRFGKKDLAMFLASEMVALGIRPDVLTYDRLVLVCLMEVDYEDAFRYLEEMRSMFEGSELRVGTWTALVKRCVAAEDGRAWNILEELEGRGHNVSRLRRWAEDAWKRNPVGTTSIEDWKEGGEDGRYQAGS